MEKIKNIIDGIIFSLCGAFLALYSKRLSSVLIKSSNLLRDAFNIKSKLGKGVEIFTQIFLIIFGLMFVVIGIKLIINFLTNKIDGPVF